MILTHLHSKKKGNEIMSKKNYTFNSTEMHKLDREKPTQEKTEKEYVFEDTPIESVEPEIDPNEVQVQSVQPEPIVRASVIKNPERSELQLDWKNAKQPIFSLGRYLDTYLQERLKLDDVGITTPLTQTQRRDSEILTFESIQNFCERSYKFNKIENYDLLADFINQYKDTPYVTTDGFLGGYAYTYGQIDFKSYAQVHLFVNTMVLMMNNKPTNKSKLSQETPISFQDYVGYHLHKRERPHYVFDVAVPKKYIDFPYDPKNSRYKNV